MICPINILLQCTTKELPYIIRLLSTIPNPYTKENEEKIDFIICSDIRFTKIEKQIIRRIASHSNFCKYYRLHIESCEQNPSHSVYDRANRSPIPALPYGRKNGPNQGFFSVLSIAQLYNKENQAFTLLLEPDCIIIKNGWLISLFQELQQNPGNIIYGAKPRYEFLPNTWSDKFKKEFFNNKCDRYNGVAIYDTNHPNFRELIDLWSLLLTEITRHVDPLCAFDLVASTLVDYRQGGLGYYSRNTSITDKLSDKSYADRFLELYYSKGFEIKKIVDASSFDFSNCVNRIESLFQKDQISILHTKLHFPVRLFLSKEHCSPANNRTQDECFSRVNELSSSQQKIMETLFKFHSTIIFSSDTALESVKLLKSSSDFTPRYLFTIVTVNFNNKDGLHKTIDSVKRQTYKNFQYIIIDGGSRDGSVDVINDNIDWINLIISEQDDGVYNAMNKGLDLALGQYILYLNSGDTFPNKKVLSNISDSILSNQEPDIVYGNTRYKSNQKLWKANKNPSEIWKGMICSHQSIFINTQIAERYRFNEFNKIVSDWQMIMNCVMDNATCHAVNFAISEIEPVGISSDFLTRTLERWKLIREKFFNNKLKLKEIDIFYISLIRSHQEPTDPTSKQSLQSNYESISNKKIDSRLIFLISMPRSGSTLLQRILESCEEIGSCGESWVALPPIASNNPTISQSKYEVKLSNHAFSEACKELKLDKNIVKSAQYEYLKVIYSEFLKKLDKEYFLDKTPRYVHILQELYDLFPSARFIVLTRQPSAIINSYASTWCSKNYTILANHSSFSFDIYQGFPKLIKFIQQKRSNVLTISYEDLCQESETICYQLSEFLSFKVTPRISQSTSALQRSLGDPKQINSSSRINRQSAGNLGKQSDFVGSKSYDLICSKIPKFVWDYFKQSRSVQANKKTFFLEVRNLSHTIIITCFNNQNTIIAAIDSAVKQIRQPDQIIIIDDKSIDNSVSAVKNYISQCDKRIDIKIIENEQNLGVSSSRHKAILSSSSDFISTLDGDDTISPSKIDMEMKAISRTGSEVAFSDIRLLTEENVQILNTRGYNKKSVESIVNMLLTRSAPVPRDLTFSRNIYNKTGGFEPSFNLFEDWMLKQRLAVLAGDKSWVHSGIIGTTYDRRNPGLSNKNPTQLMYAQILVLAKNVHFFEGININFPAVIAMLVRIDPLVEKILSKHCRTSLSEEVCAQSTFNFLGKISRSIKDMPGYLAEADVIYRALGEL